MSDANGVLGGTIYETVQLVLAAGEKRPVYGDISYLNILSATNAAQVAISFSGSAFFPLPTGISLAKFDANLVWVQNTDVSPNTIVLQKGLAEIRDNRLVIDATNSLATTVTNTVAENLTQVGGVAVPSSGVAGVLAIGGVVADSAVLGAINPLYVGGRVQTSLDSTLTGGDMGSLRMTTGGALISKDYAGPEWDWHAPAAAGGIVNTTVAVTAKIAGGGGVRNYITSIDLMAEALTTATEFAIRDGAAGTVIWRTKIPTTGLPACTIVFPTPLKGTAATLVEIVTLTASGAGAVYCNVHGYQGV